MIYINRDIVYRISANELYTRRLYSSMVGVGIVSGRLPSTFNIKKDKFYVNSTVDKIIVVNNNKTVTVFDFFTSDFNYLPIKNTYSLSNLGGSVLDTEIYWNESNNPLLWTKIFGLNNGIEQSIIFDLNNELRKIIEFNSESKPLMSPDLKKICFSNNENLDVYNLNDWSLRARLSGEKIVSYLWGDNNTIYVGGISTVREWKIPENKNNENFNGKEFIVQNVSSMRQQAFEKATDNAMDLGEKAKLPLPIRIFHWICGFVGTISLVGFIRAIGDEDGVTFAEAYQNAPWFFWLMVACLVVWVILKVISQKKEKEIIKRRLGASFNLFGCIFNELKPLFKENGMNIENELKFYNLLSEKMPTKKDVVSEIINLQAILSLPKGTEYFISDIHGEHEHFIHMMRTASGVIRAKINDIFKDTLSNDEKIRLANLIYYPEKTLDITEKDNEWYKKNLLRLIDVCKIACGKYTRSKVRKALPEKYAYIIDELLNCDAKNINKEHYYNKIVESIIALDSADDFIIEIAGVIHTLSIDHLHIVGDIFDRGPRPDIVMDAIIKNRSYDIQWGNHDVVWMGAMMGQDACIAIAVANSLKYKNTLFLEEGYGVSLRKLESFAVSHYDGSDDLEKMYKAISVIRFKLEDRLIKENPEFLMADRTKLDKIDFKNSTWCGYELKTDDFSTINPDCPDCLTDEEKSVIENLKHSFLNSEKLQKHLSIQRGF